MVRCDGVIELNAHYMIEADDGARIYISNLGYVHGPLLAPGQAPAEAPATELAANVAQRVHRPAACSSFHPPAAVGLSSRNVPSRSSL